MKQLIKIILISVIIGLIPMKVVQASEPVSVATATLAGATVETSDNGADNRIEQLRGYLNSVGSPMSEDARHSVAEADRLNLDWRLVAAIAGNESYFGQYIPYDSYNAWGWAVYTGMSDGRHFTDWQEGITTVSEGLKENYIDQELETVEQIGEKYAADPYWASKVQYFMDEITNFKPDQTKTLALSL